MNKSRLLSRKERAYIIEKISGLDTYKNYFDEMSNIEEEDLVSSIIGKIQAPQDLEG